MRSDAREIRRIRNDAVEIFEPVGNGNVAAFVVSPTEDAVFLAMKGSTIVQRFDRNKVTPTWQRDSLQGTLQMNISPDGKFLSTVNSPAHDLVISSAETGVERTTLRAERSKTADPFGTHCFNSAAEWIASANHDRSVQLWDATDRSLITGYVVPQRGGRPKIAVSPTEPLLAVTEHLKVTVYRVAGNEILQSVMPNTGVIRDLTSTAAGRLLATIAFKEGDRNERHLSYGVYDTTTKLSVLRHLRRVVSTVDLQQEALMVDFSPNERQLLTNGWEYRPLAFPVGSADADSVQEPPGTDDYWIDATDIELSQTDIGSEDSEVRRMKLTLPKLPASVFEDQKVDLDRIVYIVCSVPEAVAGQVQIHARPNDRARSNDQVINKTRVASSDDGKVAIWVGNHRLHFHGPRLEVDLVFEPSIKGLQIEGAIVRSGRFKDMVEQAVPGDAPAKLSGVTSHRDTGTVWAVGNEEHLAVGRPPAFARGTSWTNDSISKELGRSTLSPMLATEKWVVAGTTAGEVFVFDATTRQMVKSSMVLEDRISSLCEIPGQELLAVGSSNGLIQFVQLPSLEFQRSLSVGELAVDAMCFDPTRQWLFTGSEDGTMSVFHQVGNDFTLHFQTDLKLGAIQKLIYLQQPDSLAVLIKNETAVRLLQLKPLSDSLTGFAQVNSQAAGLNGTGSDLGPVQFDADGVFAPSRNVTGRVSTDFTIPVSGDDFALAVSRVPGDGKLVVVGRSEDAHGVNRLATSRHNSDGTLDTTFGEAGQVIVDFGDWASFWADAVAIDADCRIVVAGRKEDSNGNRDFGVVRLNADGSPDTSFAGDGRVAVDFAGGNDEASAVAIQSDGRIVVAGVAAISAANPTDFAAIRLNTDGTLDTTFDRDGKQTVDFETRADFAIDLAIQADGKFVLVGASAGSDTAFGVARLNTDGSLDNTFSFDGRQRIGTQGLQNVARAVAVHDDGRIVVAGYSIVSGNYDFSVVLLTADGNPDVTFDGDGKRTFDFMGGDDRAEDVAIDANGRIVVAGWAWGRETEFDDAIARLNTDGSLDNTFDADGKQTADIGGSQNGLYGLTLQSDGSMVVVGETLSSNGTGMDFGVARFGATGAFDETWGTAGTDFITPESGDDL